MKAVFNATGIDRKRRSRIPIPNWGMAPESYVCTRLGLTPASLIRTTAPQGAKKNPRASIEATRKFRGLRLTIACVSLHIYVRILLYSFATTQNDCTFLVSEIGLGKSTYKALLSKAPCCGGRAPNGEVKI